MFIFQQPALFPWLDLERNLVFGLNGQPEEVRRSLFDVLTPEQLGHLTEICATLRNTLEQ